VSVSPLIRLCRRDELEQVLALWARADAQPTVTDDERALAVLVEHDPEALLVAEIEGEIVGTLAVCWDGWRGSMYRLAVVPELRRRGIARELVAAGENRLWAFGVRRLAVIVVDTDEPAVAFWLALGYEQQSARARFVKMPSDTR
jgi:ribosomal protein S18 acetylase RimI-like enzyme